MWAASACQSLPLVSGVTVSEYYGLIRLPHRHWLSYLVFRSAYLPSFFGAGTLRVSQVPDASRHTYHALDGPRQALGELTLTFSLCWLRTPLSPRHLHYSPLTRLYQASGSAVSPTVYVIRCVRFNYSVRKWPRGLTRLVWMGLLSPYCVFRVMSFPYLVVESFLLDSCNTR